VTDDLRPADRAAAREANEHFHRAFESLDLGRRAGRCLLAHHHASHILALQDPGPEAA
jgi:hypothetical protein